MTVRPRSLALLTFLSLSVAASAARAQQSGSLAGHLTDESGNPVASARVEAFAGGKLAGSAVSGPGGEYRIGGLPPGSYSVVISAVAYDTRRIAGVRVTAGQATEVSASIATVAFRLNPIVVTASRKQEKAVDAPATVAVVDSRALEERPTVTPVDHLRATPGVDIFNSGIQSTNVVLRGFNNIFSGAVMALTDYRSASVPSLRVNFLHFIPANDDDIERIEVVLGPGSALYGPNTANGVLHIITRSPLEEQGTTFSVGGGTQGVYQATFRSAQKVSERFALKASGQYFRATEFNYTDPVEAFNRAEFHGDSAASFRRDLMQATGIDGAEADRRIALIGHRDNAVRRWSGDLRADWQAGRKSTLVLETGATNLGSAIELTALGAAQARDWRYAFAQARFTHERFFAQAYVNASDAGDTYLLRNGAPIVDHSRLYVAQVQHGLTLGKENLTYGADFIHTNPVTDGTINGIYEDHDQTTEIGGYLQSETAIGPKLKVVLAGRLDHSTAIPDAVASPRAGLVFKPTPTQAFRFTYNRAFSTPTSLNQFLDLATTAPDARLARLGYSVRVQGTGRTGFHFRQPNGGYLMVSPFNTQNPGAKIPADAASMWAAAVQVLAANSAQLAAQPQLVSFLASLRPTTADIGTDWVNPQNAQAPAPLSSLPPDIPRIREGITNTFELGYQGVLWDRLLLAADVWRRTEERMTSSLALAAPLLFLNGAQTGTYLLPRLIQFLQAGGMSPAEAQAQAQVYAPLIASGLAQVPVGAITGDEVVEHGAQILATEYNVDDQLNLYGADFAATFLVTRTVSLKGTLSLVNKDLFTTKLGQTVTLNAPQEKGTLSVIYDGDRSGAHAELRGRYTAGFPVASGEYNGTLCLGGAQPDWAEPCVARYTLLDADFAYPVPRTAATLQLAGQNLLGTGYRSFPGVPTIGRLLLLRVKYNL